MAAWTNAQFRPLTNIEKFLEMYLVLHSETRKYSSDFSNNIMNAKKLEMFCCRSYSWCNTIKQQTYIYKRLKWVARGHIRCYSKPKRNTEHAQPHNSRHMNSTHYTQNTYRDKVAMCAKIRMHIDKRFVVFCSMLTNYANRHRFCRRRKKRKI